MLYIRSYNFFSENNLSNSSFESWFDNQANKVLAPCHVVPPDEQPCWCCRGLQSRSRPSTTHILVLHGPCQIKQEPLTWTFSLLYNCNFDIWSQLPLWSKTVSWAGGPIVWLRNLIVYCDQNAWCLAIKYHDYLIRRMMNL